MNALRIAVPLILGAIAGGINFFVVQGLVKPLELTAVSADLKADAEITSEAMLTKVQVRSDSEVIFKSAIKWADRGVAVKRRVNRPLAAGEVLLFADVRGEGSEDIRAMLKPGEVTLSFAVRSSRVAPGLRPEDKIGLYVRNPAEGSGERRVLGPFRLLALGERSSPFRPADDQRQVVVAVPLTEQKSLPPGALELDAAASPDGSTRGGNVLAVEFYKAP